jgi:glycosyltransferase involved in cell wall biosynthesis
MRVAIDGRAIMEVPDGIGRYSHCMVEHLSKLDTRNEYTVFVQRPHFSFPESSNFREVILPYHYVNPYTILSFHRDLQKAGAELLFAPFFYSPLFFKGPTVLTVHDLMWVLHPHLMGRSHTLTDQVKRLAHKIFVPRSMMNARELLSVSQATTQELSEHFPHLASKVTTVLLGMDHMARAGYVVPQEDREPYILFTGSSKPYKNMDGAIRCFDLLTQRPQFKDWRLKIPGRVDSFRGHIQQLVQGLASRDRIELLGPTPEDTLARLYQHASLLLFPSRMEGFGIPVLEAMHYGTPVVTSNRSSLPEVAGGCACLVDPDDVPAMVHACAALLADLPRRKELSALGMARAASFHWEGTARATLKVLDRACDGRLGVPSDR